MSLPVPVDWTTNSGMRGTPTAAAQPPAEEFLAQLRRHIAAREVGSGISCLRSHIQIIDRLDPQQDNAARLGAHFAVWVDIGYDGLQRLNELLKRFEPR